MIRRRGTLTARAFLSTSLLVAAGTVCSAAEPPAALVTDYRLHAGDKLDIAVWKEKELTREITVSPDGRRMIVIPSAGTSRPVLFGQGLQRISRFAKRLSGLEAQEAAIDRNSSGTLAVGRAPQSGTFARSSSTHTAAEASLGALQSPRGLSAPAVETFGPLGLALRLNWLKAKKRARKLSSQRLIVARS